MWGDRSYYGDRRSFMKRLLSLGIGTSMLTRTISSENVDPSCISGDKPSTVLPYVGRITVTVGTSPEADIQGNSHTAIQSAIHYVASSGGGVVKILPGTYRFRNAIYLSSHVHLFGSGDTTIFIKEPMVETELSIESDWYEQCLSVAHPERFKVGDGLCIRTKNPHHGGLDVMKRTITAIEGNKLHLDKSLRQNVWFQKETTIATLFPLISGEFVEDVRIENIVLDGNKSNNALLDGNYAGCIWLQDCNRIIIRNVEARNYNGDGISWQICHDVSVENCYLHDNTQLGLHPGSGSQRSNIAQCRIENNNTGIFFCWGVQYAMAEHNKISNNTIGISIGHRDNFNIIQNNQIVNSGEYAILFRPEPEAFSAKGNKVVNNTIQNVMKENAIGISIDGFSTNNEIIRNNLLNLENPGKKVGIKVGKNAKANVISDNTIQGFALDLFYEGQEN